MGNRPFGSGSRPHAWLAQRKSACVTDRKRWFDSTAGLETLMRRGGLLRLRIGRRGFESLRRHPCRCSSVDEHPVPTSPPVLSVSRKVAGSGAQPASKPGPGQRLMVRLHHLPRQQSSVLSPQSSARAVDRRLTTDDCLCQIVQRAARPALNREVGVRVFVWQPSIRCAG